MTHILNRVKFRFGIILVAMIMAVAGIGVLPAQAAQGMKLDCSLRVSNFAQVLANGAWRIVGCGGTYSTVAANGITYVTDTSGPYCVYFNGGLAGCGGKGEVRSVANRSGWYGVLKPQPLGS